MPDNPLPFQKIFFIGIAGTGMSAIAQYLHGSGKIVSGSDRYFQPGVFNETRDKLEAEGIRCFEQNGDGITADTDLVVVSTAIEETVPEVIKTRELNIPILKRSELLARIAETKKTIAIGGTSGKSTTAGMLYDILLHAGLQPGIISGAGLISLIEQGKIGNAAVGKGEWLVIEADESDGSIVQYKPAIGVLLNVDKDHKDLDELMKVFGIFKNNSAQFIVNRSHPLAASLGVDAGRDFSADPHIRAGYNADFFHPDGLSSRFRINETPFVIHTIGKINMENALAAAAVANVIGVSLGTAAEAVSDYKGIYRRHQVLGKKNGVLVIDDYAHNPVKCAGSIAACQALAPKVIAWFQPHGYGPTKFLRNDFVHEISSVLRREDEIWMSEIFYAGGTAIKDISAADLINDLKEKGSHAYFVSDRKDLPAAIREHLTDDCVVLLMGARDPSLEKFAAWFWEQL